MKAEALYMHYIVPTVVRKSHTYCTVTKMTKALTYEQMNEIESHFIYAGEERMRIQQMTTDIAEASSYALDPTGIHGTKISDKTAVQAARVEKETRVLRAWSDVVKETFEHFKNDVLMIDLMSMLYVERVSAEEIMERLFIGKTTLYEYRKEILRYAALKAVAKGVLEVA